MNILIIHNYYKIRGGEDIVFENEVDALKKSSSVKVVSFCVNNRETEGGFFHKLAYLYKILSGNRKLKNEIVKIIKDNNIGIVHIHNVFPLITPFIYRSLKKHTKVKIVQTIHNFRFVCPSGLLFRDGKICRVCLENKNFRECVLSGCYRKSKLFSALYSFLIEKSRKSLRSDIDCYLALTDFTASILAEAGFPKYKIKVRGNCLPDIKNTVRGEGEYYLFIGRISPEKGVENAVKAFAALPECKLVIAGTGELESRLKEKYAAYENILFFGFADDAAKERLLSHAKAVIVPSIWYENFPMVIIEAFRHGIPVISNNWGAVKGIVSDNVNGLLFGKENDTDEKRAENIAESVRLFESDVSLRNRLGDNARQTFLNKMESGKSIAGLIRIYEELENDS